MSTSFAGLLVGGVLPAVILGVFGVLQKGCLRAGLGIGPFFVLVGATIALFGVAYCLATAQRAVTPAGGLCAIATGLLWAAGTACIVLAVSRFGASISQLAPLYNMNTLVVVLLGLAVFAEWRQVHPLPLLAGALLIVGGAVLVSRA